MFVEPDLASQDSDRSASPLGSAPLNGTLEDNTPAGVLQMLSSQGETGAVRFSGSNSCTVYIDQGELYFAEDADTGEDLAMALVRPGRLTADEWDQATATGYPTESVGEAILATGSIDREMLASVVLSVIYDPLIQLFRAPEGDFEFEPGVVHWIGPFRSFSVDAIVAEVRRRTREADEMAPVIPSLDAWVRTARTLPPDHGNVSLRRDDWEVVITAANGATVNALAAELGRGRWSTARLVYRLASVNLLEVTESNPDPTFAPPSADDFASPFTPIAGDEPATSFENVSQFDAPAAFGDTGGFTEPDATDALATMGDTPPPLNLDDFTAAPESESTDDSWSSGSSWEPAGWNTPDADEPPAATDSPWGAPAEATESAWDTSAANDPWDAPVTDETPVEDAASFNHDGAGDEPADAPAAAPDGDFGIEFEAPALHPDIAKALAESTYADSATAINAMAARLGAIEGDDDDDDFDDATSANADTSDFWSNDVGDQGFPWNESSGEPRANEEFSWQPAVWDAGVESTPLPQREHVPAAAEPIAPHEGDDHGSDPQWLENLYSQFMPGGEGKGAAAPEAQDPNFGADPGEAPKAKTLKRLMSAIRRL